mgnify:CR=1 FL=1
MFVIIALGLFPRPGVMNVAEDGEADAAHAQAQEACVPAGRMMLKVVPLFGWLSTVINP